MTFHAVGLSCSAQLIVAHRGASFAAPENTLAAFLLAWQQGADAIEGDFYLTADNQIVALHDATTERTADANLSVAEATLAQLSQLDMGSWKGPQYRGEKMPTLADVLGIVPDDKKILIEIKCGPEIVPHLKEQLAASSLKPSQTIVICFKEPVVKLVKEQLPDVPAYWLTSYKQDEATGHWSPTVDEVLSVLARTGCEGLDTQANVEVVDAEFVRRIREAGYELHTWTIDDPEVARHFAGLGVDSITTNRPQFVRTQLSAASPAE